MSEREKFLELNDKMSKITLREVADKCGIVTYHNSYHFRTDNLNFQMEMVQQQLKLLQEQIDKINEKLNSLK